MLLSELPLGPAAQFRVGILRRSRHVLSCGRGGSYLSGSCLSQSCILESNRNPPISRSIEATPMKCDTAYEGQQDGTPYRTSASAHTAFLSWLFVRNWGVMCGGHYFQHALVGGRYFGFAPPLSDHDPQKGACQGFHEPAGRFFPNRDAGIPRRVLVPAEVSQEGVDISWKLQKVGMRSREFLQASLTHK